MTDITSQTKVVGVMGWPIKHSLSAPMQNAALAEALADLTNDFEYDTILAVLHQARERVME